MTTNTASASAPTVPAPASAPAHGSVTDGATTTASGAPAGPAILCPSADSAPAAVAQFVAGFCDVSPELNRDNFCTMMQSTVDGWLRRLSSNGRTTDPDSRMATLTFTPDPNTSSPKSYVPTGPRGFGQYLDETYGPNALTIMDNKIPPFALQGTGELVMTITTDLVVLGGRVIVWMSPGLRATLGIQLGQTAPQES